MPINQLASMSVPEARVIQITPWDQSTSQVIDRALQKANLGLGINSDGKVIRVVFPELNEERRKEFVKSAHGKAEEGRIAIRNIRRDANDHVKALQAKHEISEDDGKRALDEIQKKSDEAIKQLNHHLEAKEKEIMEI
jgi:ribosome recycling factor